MDLLTDATNQRATGGQILVSALRDQGVDRVFCVPGESYLPVLDALHDVVDIAVVSARHEGAASNMAEADGKLTGRPGICFVTRGPGATHACIGVHTAFQDSTPMILFIGQVARDARDREGFQEIDYRAMFAPLAKWAAEIDDASRIPEYVARAFQTATSGRAGPVVLSLPEDMLSAEVPLPVPVRRATASASTVRAADLAAVVEILGAASRPLIVVGGSGWTHAGSKALLEFAGKNGLPLVASFRRQDLVDNRSDNYCGHLGLGVDPQLAERLKSADVIVSLGSRLGENTTGGYTLLTPGRPQQKLIHVYPDPNEPGRVFQPELAISCSANEFALALSSVQISGAETRKAWLSEARATYVKFSTPTMPPVKGVDVAEVIKWLSDHLPSNAIISNGAGNYTVWVHRYFRYRELHTELAPISGAMGYGIPAGIAAQLRYPQRTVVAFAGDGCFLMYPQELGTAVQYGAKLLVIVINNGIYGTIRMHQERRYPGRIVGTDILNPNFVELAHSYGAHAERVETTEGFPGAFERALSADRATLIELCVDPAQLTPGFRLSE